MSFFWKAVGNWITSWSTHPRRPPLPDEVWLKIVLMMSKDFKRDKDILKGEIRMLKDHVQMLRAEVRHRLKLQKAWHGFQKASQFFIPPSLFDTMFPYLIMGMTMAIILAGIIMFVTIATTAA